MMGRSGSTEMGPVGQRASRRKHRGREAGRAEEENVPRGAVVSDREGALNARLRYLPLTRGSGKPWDFQSREIGEAVC